MSAKLDSICTYCSKECKSTDSRPYPSSKSKERIHNKCRLKMAVAAKRTGGDPKPDVSGQTTRKSNTSHASFAVSIEDRLARDEIDLRRTNSDSKPLEQARTSASGAGDASTLGRQFFFDLEAGIAKPEEKRRYLHHKRLTDFVARYDQDGFKEEAIGRCYDTRGKDLDVLEDETDQGSERGSPRIACTKADSLKRKRDVGDANAQSDKRASLQKQKCWFCLSSEEADKELVIAVGKYCYLALEKFGLTDDHLLIVPLSHICSIRSDHNSKQLLDELESFKKDLVEFCGSRSKAVVFYERNIKSFHWHLQVVPIPIAMFDSIEEKLRRISLRHYEKLNFVPFQKHYSLNDIIATENTPYFCWQSRSASSIRCVNLTSQVDANDREFPIQLGRIVLADKEILNCAERVDQRNCDKTDQKWELVVRSLRESLEYLNA